MKPKKKGLFTLAFAPGMVIMGLVVLISAMIMLNGKYEATKNHPIGERQLQYISAIQAGEKAMIYVESAGRIAADNAFKELAENGGYYKESPCGRYNGYKLWNSADKECYPTEISKDYSKFAKGSITPGLFRYPLPIENDFDFSIISGTPMKVYGVKASFAEVDLDKLGSYQARAGIDISNVRVPKKDLDQLYKDYGAKVVAAAKAQGISPSYMLAILAVESSGNPNAISPTGAAGLMQFTAATARQFFEPADVGQIVACCYTYEADMGICNQQGVFRCPPTDPRFDVDKSIVAASKLLKTNLDMFSKYQNKEWFAAAAYNGGPQTIINALKSSGNSNNWLVGYADLLDYGIREETQEYPFKVMAYKKQIEEKFPETIT